MPYMDAAKTVEWETPQWLFDQLNTEFGFTVDACATPENAKCKRDYTPEQDGLVQNWGGEIVWCNPPYGREMPKWIAKAHSEAIKGATVVMLIPSRTDTKAFHDYLLGQAELRFLRGRLKFGDSKSPAPFPSMVAVFEGEGRSSHEPKVDHMDAQRGIVEVRQPADG